LEQLDLQLFELEEDQAQVEAKAELSAPQGVTVQPFECRKPARRPLPDHLPRERLVYPVPQACPCWGGTLHKLGEDVTESLELVPRQWKMTQHVREKYSCRRCEQITQPPAPCHLIARGRAGPGLLAHVLFGKYGLHLPLTRQSTTFAREGVQLDVSTLADWVGASAATLMPLVEAIGAHVLGLHADDTTVPVLDVGKTRTGRLWTYVRDDRPFNGADPPAAIYFYSPDRGGGHPEAHLAGWQGLMQADAYSGFNQLYEPGRQPGHDRRGRLLGPCAALLLRAGAIEQGADRHRGCRPHRCAVRHRARDQWRLPCGAPCVRQERSKLLVEAFGHWPREQHAKVSPNGKTAKAIAYSLNA